MSEYPKRSRHLDRPSIELTNNKRLPQIVGFNNAEYDIDHPKVREWLRGEKVKRHTMTVEKYQRILYRKSKPIKGR